MSDKSTQTKKKLAQNADKITIAVLALILLGLGYAWWQEQNTSLGSQTFDRASKPANLKDELAESPSLQMLQNMSGTPALDRDPEIQRVAQLNMFDFSTIQAERTLEQQGEAQIIQAQDLIKQGKKDEARELLLQAKKIIAYRPELQQALDQVTTKTETGAPADPNAPAAM